MRRRERMSSINASYPSSTDTPTRDASETYTSAGQERPRVKIYFDDICGFRLRIISTLDQYDGTPLLIFNGIGASVELLEPILKALKVPAISFDMPGTGGSPVGLVGFRMSKFTSIGLALIDRLEIPIANIMGVSWGGAVAQEFARRHASRTHKLILAATSMGQVMVSP